MPIKDYKAKVQPGGKGHPVEVRIQANSVFDAKRLLEGQYGKGSVKSGPMTV